MFIAGVNMGSTRDGLQLKDGAACILRDGEIILAIAEERLSRKKHAGGFALALQYCLTETGLTVDDLDMIVVSTCAEEPLTDGWDIGFPGAASKVHAMPSHHLSHAYAAFMTSPFDEAAIMVIDNEGNLLGGRRDSRHWNNRLERNSYYLGHGDTIELLEAADDRLADREIGPGEAYRNFTHFLGWPSYVYAGNTMGLAPFGDHEVFAALQVFRLESGQIHSDLGNGQDNPSAAVLEFARANGVRLGPPRTADGELTQRHANIAATIQYELERALIYKARELQRLTGAKNLCLGGGVALNCVANRKILDQTGFERIFICPAPGDSGQCLGNALYGWIDLGGQPRRKAPVKSYLGRSYSESEITGSITVFGDLLTHGKSPAIARDAARLLVDGHVIGWFQGGSELGPRALGNRSILADATNPGMTDYLNLVVKGRSPFRPFAPSVLQDRAEEFYDLPQNSPYMELTAIAHPGVRHRIPAVTHVDWSARPQTVTSDDNPVFAELILEYERISGLPLLLNTSFNLSGEPIVESPKDALECFLRSELDCLVLADFLVWRAEPSGEPRFRAWAISGQTQQ